MTVDPSTNSLSSRVQADVNDVQNRAEPGYSFRGAVNVPPTDTLAVRASAFTGLDPGYIDNPILDVDGVNEDHANGGRLATLWRRSEIFSLKVSALYQDTKGNGLGDVDVLPGLGNLQQDYIRGAGGWDKQIQAYSAILTAKLSGVDLMAISGYNINSFSNTLDDTSSLGQFANKYFGAQNHPACAKADLHSGVTYDSWTANLYVNNLANELGLLGGGTGTYPTFAFLYIQPRTAGLSLTRSF